MTVPVMPNRLPLRHPHMAHFLPYSLGDSLAGINKANKAGFLWVDQDGVCDKEGKFWVKHWGYPKSDGFKWLWTGKFFNGKEVRVPDPKPGVPIHKRTSENVARLRTVRFGDSGHYYSARQHAVWCRNRGLRMMYEPKGQPGFEDDANWARFRAELNRFGCDNVGVMSLQDITGCRYRLRAAKRGGKFKTAVLPRGRKPVLWDIYWDQWVDSVWGAWR